MIPTTLSPDAVLTDAASNNVLTGPMRNPSTNPLNNSSNRQAASAEMFSPSVDWMLERWTAMARIRLAEEAIAALVESDEATGPCHLYIGEEAIAAGVCAALECAIRCGAATAPTVITWRAAHRLRAVE